MVTMFVMKTCPYCEYVERQVERVHADHHGMFVGRKGDQEYKVIDIGAHVRNLKQFLDLRDHSSAFDEAKRIGDVGIPCYILEDGTVTLNSSDAGLTPMPEPSAIAQPTDAAPSCRLDGTGC